MVFTSQEQVFFMPQRCIPTWKDLASSVAGEKNSDAATGPLDSESHTMSL